MAQDGPHDHQDTASSDEHGFTPPTTMTFLGPAENHNGGSKIGSPVGMDGNKGKDVVPLPHAIQDGEHGSACCGGSKGKHIAAGEASADAATDDFSGKSSIAADDGDLKAHIITERERRRRMKDMFTSLHALMPHVPEKVDKATLVGETIHFIRALEQTKIQLEKRKKEQALARQAAAEAAVSSFMAFHTAQGMAAMANGRGPVPHPQQRQPPLAAAVAVPPPPLATATGGPIGFQTWSAPNVVLSVSNDKAIINMCLPRQPRMLTLVMSVLHKHGIDVITAHVVPDGARSLFTIYTRVARAGGQNPSAEDIYKLAVSEIMVWLTT